MKLQRLSVKIVKQSEPDYKIKKLQQYEEGEEDLHAGISSKVHTQKLYDIKYLICSILLYCC